MTPYDIYLRANARIDDLIDLAPVHELGSIAVRKRAAERFEWMRGFAQFLGNPQFSAPVIHVTGTSGKGSTATAIASILNHAGLRVLLHTSPYLQVSTEKLQIGGQLISADDLAELTENVISAADRHDPARITYGEAWMGIVFFAMERFRPDVAIVEVGAGGRFDLSNVVSPAVAVITTVGIDHVESLGETIEEIAWHKAGIIKPGTQVVHSATQLEAIAAIDREARDVRAGEVEHVAHPAAGSSDESWIDAGSGRELRNGISGRIQMQNGALAVAAARAFLPGIAIESVESGLAAARIPARLERMPGDPLLLLDGAHNEQKMAALSQDLDRLPHPRIGVVGFLASKRFEAMLQHLTPQLDGFVVSAPDVVGKAAIGPAQLAESVAVATRKPIQIATSTDDAVNLAIDLAGSDGSVLVTGSLYLCGQARERWFPGRAIVEQQTQWPD